MDKRGQDYSRYFLSSLFLLSSPLFAVFTREAVPSLTGGLIEFMHPREAAASGKVERTYVLANAG